MISQRKDIQCPEDINFRNRGVEGKSDRLWNPNTLSDPEKDSLEGGKGREEVVTV